MTLTVQRCRSDEASGSDDVAIQRSGSAGGYVMRVQIKINERGVAVKPRLFEA